MSQEPNPKDFYNRSDYTPALAKGAPNSRGGLNKPDDVPSQPPLPPPPYSPAPSSTGLPPPPQQQQRPVGTYGALLTSDHQGYSVPHPSSSSSRQGPSSADGASGSAGPPSLSSRDNNGVSKSNKNNDDNERVPLLSLLKDNKDRRTCFKKSLKFLLAVLLLGVGTWKSIDYIRPPRPSPTPAPTPPPPPVVPAPSPGITCGGLDAVFWDILPRQLEFGKEIRVRTGLGGSPSTGQIIVHQTPESVRDGRMEVQVKVSTSISLDALKYEFQDGQLTFQFPTVQNDSSQCVELDMEIWVPRRAKVLIVEAPSIPIRADTPLTRMDLVDLRGKTIQIQEYEGKELRLNANGNIDMEGPVETRDPVQVISQPSSSNGGGGSVTIKDTIISKKSVSVQSSGSGQIEITRSIIADDSIVLRTANGPILLYDTIQAESVQVEAVNGDIHINTIGETAGLMVKSFNGGLDIGPIRSEKDAKTQLITINGPIVAHMTHEYEGTLSIRTSENNNIVISDQEGNIDLQIDKPYMKEGKRLDGDGTFVVSTSNANAEIYFDA